MTLRNFPPADQCTADDLDAVADLVVSDPSASYDLAGSRAHIEALCRRYQALAQERDEAQGRSTACETDLRAAAGELPVDLAAMPPGSNLRRVVMANRILRNDLDAARRAIAERENEIARINNERQAEVLQAEADRERADAAEALVEVHEAIARAALAVVTRTAPVDIAELVHAVDGRMSRALVRERKITAALSAQWEEALVKLEEIQQTRRLDDQLRSTCRTVTGKDLGEVNIMLDEELAAHPDAGPLHHARDQREPEETTP